jgi:folylpolyglutamate synthase/dihydropteroate synthase
MIKQVADSALFDRVLVAHMETKRAASLESLHALWEESGGRTAELVFCKDVRTALSKALASQEGARIYIAGSLYLVGEIKEFLRDD